MAKLELSMPYSFPSFRCGATYWRKVMKLQKKIEIAQKLQEDLKSFRNGFHAIFLDKLDSHSFDIIDGSFWRAIQDLTQEICVLQCKLRDNEPRS